MREVIRGHQRPSEVIRGHQRSSEVIRGNHTSGASPEHVAISGHQWPSATIRGNPRPFLASCGTQRQSAALSDTQRHAATMSAHLKIRDLDAEMMKSLPDLVRGDAAVAVFIEEIERPDDLLWNALKVEKLPDEHLLKGGHGVERSGLTIEGSSSGNPRPSEVQSGSQVTSRPSSGNRTSPSSRSG